MSNTKMAAEDVVHIRVEYDEAINGKRGVLSSELYALRAAKAINRYHALRVAELNVKNKIYMKMKETRATIKQIQSFLPVPRIPKIIRRTQKEELQAEAKPTAATENIESQLSEIQKRLNALSR